MQFSYDEPIPLSAHLDTVWTYVRGALVMQPDQIMVPLLPLSPLLVLVALTYPHDYDAILEWCFGALVNADEGNESVGMHRGHIAIATVAALAVPALSISFFSAGNAFIKFEVNKHPRTFIATRVHRMGQWTICRGLFLIACVAGIEVRSLALLYWVERRLCYAYAQKYSKLSNG